MQIKVIFWLKMTKTFIYNYPYKISLIKFVLSGSNFVQFSKITKICKQTKVSINKKKMVQQLAFHIWIIIFGQNSLKSATASGCLKKVMIKTSSCMTTFSCMTWIHANFAFQVGLGKKKFPRLNCSEFLWKLGIQYMYSLSTTCFQWKNKIF